jgi:hypothetical protein
MEKEGPVIKFIGFQQGVEESIGLMCLKRSQTERLHSPRGGGSAPEWNQSYYRIDLCRKRRWSCYIK